MLKQKEISASRVRVTGNCSSGRTVFARVSLTYDWRCAELLARTTE